MAKPSTNLLAYTKSKPGVCFGFWLFVQIQQFLPVFRIIPIFWAELGSQIFQNHDSLEGIKKNLYCLFSFIIVTDL